MRKDIHNVALAQVRLEALLHRVEKLELEMEHMRETTYKTAGIISLLVAIGGSLLRKVL